MKASIESIIIKERIRKDIQKIPELAEDIKLNGLINPVTVMELDGEKFQLLAGLRRIKAVQSMGLAEIEVNVVLPVDAEAALRIEFSENEQREEFTFSEKMDFANLLKEVETAKAKERMSLGGKGGIAQGTPHGAYLQKGETREFIADKIGMGRTTYDRAKYIAENASPEIIDQLDKGERTIRATYDELKATEKAAACDPAPKEKATPPHKANLPAPKRASEVSEEEQLKYLSAKDKEEYYRRKEFDALPPEGKIKDLERQLFDMRVRANNAESELETLKLEYGIKVDHKDSIIENLKGQVAELNEALDKARQRIAELEK